MLLLHPAARLTHNVHSATLLHLSALKLLRSLSNLGLDAEVLRALNGRKKLSKLALFILQKLEPLPLKLYRLVEKLADTRLVCTVSGEELCAKRLPRFPLSHHQAGALLLEIAVRCLESRHLLVAQIELALHHLASALPQLLLELETSRIRCLGLSCRSNSTRILRERWKSSHSTECGNDRKADAEHCGSHCKPLLSSTEIVIASGSAAGKPFTLSRSLTSALS
jgi:hypothetical protein